MKNRLILATLLVITNLAPIISGSYSPTSISSSGGDQFHIQTDEGPERYFRYQTHNGQYRKEKRLQDGTVVGTYGWIDGTGLLRLQDYIADTAGYRILRTKDVFVGQNRPISQAIKVAKKVAGTTGLYLPPNNNIQISSTPNYIPSSSYLPQVDITHNSYPGYAVSTTENPTLVSSTPTPPISSTILPPFSNYVTPTHPTVVISPKNPSQVYLPSGTISAFGSTTPVPSPLPIIPLPSAQPTSIVPPVIPLSHYFSSNTPRPPIYPSSSIVIPSPPPQYDYYYQNRISSTLAPPISSNSLDYYDENPYVHHNGPTYPLDKQGNPFFGNGYDPQYREGVKVTNDGFRYYIPRAYHEEQSIGHNKDGSFGYIDPFGIRRVVYYNAGPEGFKHRKNNRYVGFNATPYDPRPYKKK